MFKHTSLKPKLSFSYLKSLGSMDAKERNCSWQNDKKKSQPRNCAIHETNS